jgi:tRNA-splicing ligase RtcB
MSRAQSKKASRGHDLVAEMEARGVTVMAHGRATLAEEMPWAYKDVASVIDVMERAGVSKKVARFRPLGVIKG